MIADRAPCLRLSGDFIFGDTVLFRDVDLRLYPDRWTCLLGPSGMGKSTLLRLIAGLPTGGAFQGALTHDFAANGAISYMAQDDLLMPWASVTQNVILGARLRGDTPDLARAEQIIADVGLWGAREKRVPQLSGGMRQRVALARTLMEDRPLVLLDEPFSALDARNRAEMQALAAKMLRGRAVLLVTHDPAEAARLGDAIYLLKASGTEAFPPPQGPIPRDPSDPAVLKGGADLLRHLMDMANPGDMS